eukprot:13210.XXX_482893_482994_1 [CDS] Oithona nana genome sequencing.
MSRDFFSLQPLCQRSILVNTPTSPQPGHMTSRG